MKKLTFQNQILLGIIGLGLGHVLSWVTSNRIFENLGWIFYGLLFVIHPVCPERVGSSDRLKGWVRGVGVLIVVMGCFIRSGDSQNYFHRQISESLGIDVEKAEIVEQMDDHSGFHGDGCTYAVLSFPDEELEAQISAPGGWKQLPLTDDLTTLIYGTRTETAATGPFIGVTMPRVEEGYYFFYDRLNERYTDVAVLTLGSYNYTIGIYDSARNLLYYCEYDT